MKCRIPKILLCTSLFLAVLGFPRPANADFWGADIPLLTEIVATTLQQLTQLQQILGTGSDTLGLLRDVNQGIRDAMRMMHTANGTMQPGVLSQYQSTDELLRAVQDFYGEVPQTPEAKVQVLNDESVAEAVNLHNQAFQYADNVDPEAERIKEYAHNVSPAGAGKLTAQSLGVLINVSNQILRTNAAMLKILSENLALQNRHEKIGSSQFKMQYEGLSSAFGSTASMKDATRLEP